MPQKPIRLLPIPPPPPAQRVARDARFAAEGERRGRYHLPEQLDSGSPVGYRRRLSLTQAEADRAAALLSLEPPEAFVEGPGPTEQELFEEASLGVLSARQSTNYRGQRQTVLGQEDSRQLHLLLQRAGLPSLAGATHSLIGLYRPYWTPFTMLLTFVGHTALGSLATVPWRAWKKYSAEAVDIPTIGYLPDLHIGIWADATERAALLASGGRRRAHTLIGPWPGALRTQLEDLAGLTLTERRAGWRLGLVAQIGNVQAGAAETGAGTGASLDAIDPALCRKLGALLLSLRSERIQPGVNQEEKAPAAYQARQEMDVPAELVEMAGRAGYNAFHRWTGCDREAAKALLLMERVDVLEGGKSGKERLREIRKELEEITDKVVAGIPLWVDLPTGRKISTNAERGRKAFALTGQRIYIGGLSPAAVAAAGIPWERALRAFGAAASRSALVCELAGCIGIPEGCDMLGGICLMAGPVNQNDIGKQYYGYKDLLAGAHPGTDATALLVWTLKAKTVADPIGNEEQLQSHARKGALVDLRPAPHEAVNLRIGGGIVPMRSRDGRTNAERAFGDQQNFVVAPDGRHIPGNTGSAWPRAWADVNPWQERP